MPKVTDGLIEATRRIALRWECALPYIPASGECPSESNAFRCRRCSAVSILGKNAVSNPIAGRNEHTLYTNSMPVLSAIQPSTAAPIPPMPNANPKNNPEIIPTFPGTSSCAYTRIAEKADARITPMTTLSTAVQKRFAYGSTSVNGSTPRMEHQITYLRPTLSPTGPPMMVPAATAPSRMKRWICDDCTDTPNLWMRKNV